MKTSRKYHVICSLLFLILGLCACGEKEETAKDVATKEAGYTSAASFEQEKGSVEAVADTAEGAQENGEDRKSVV